MTTMREFGRDDWAAWSGAEPFADGSEPLIGECEVSELPATVLVDRVGIIVDILIEREDAIALDVPFGPLAFAIDCEPAEGARVARSLPRRLTIATLEAAGFYHL